ncbi:MAG: TAXI family TRAP transporter solute-binding subunit [Nitrospinota bacterium]
MRKLSRLVVCAVVALSVVGWAAADITQGAEKARVAVVGAGPGAGAFRLAGALAAVVSKVSKKVEMTNRASKGFVANARLVNSGTADFGMCNGPLLTDAMLGQNKYKRKHLNIRGIGPVTTSWFHIITLERQGVRKLADLKGGRINFAAKGSNTEFMTSLIFKWAGYFAGVTKNYQRWDHAARALMDGKIDAFTIPNPIPSPSVLTASTGGNIFLVSIPDGMQDKFIKMNPGYYKSVIPAGSYKGQKQAAKTVAYTIYSIVNKDVPARVVYEVTRINYDPANYRFLVSAFKSWRIGLRAAPDLKGMASFNLKLHPGAERYWKERGIPIPTKIAN